MVHLLERGDIRLRVVITATAAAIGLALRQNRDDPRNKGLSGCDVFVPWGPKTPIYHNFAEVVNSRRPGVAGSSQNRDPPMLYGQERMALH